MALVKTIKDRNTDDTIYPITKADAVYLSDNETTVEGALGDLSTISSIGDGTIAGAINALNSNTNIRSYFLGIAANTNTTTQVELDSLLQISWFTGIAPKGVVLLRIHNDGRLTPLYLGDTSNIKPSFSYSNGILTIQNNDSTFFRSIIL